MLGADGKAVEAKGLKWELLRLDQRWQWYSRDGSWTYEPVDAARGASASGTVDAAAGAPAKIEARVDWGRYRLEVSDSDGSGLISSTVFNAGYWADEGADSPEVLDVALDKPSYRAGDTARVKITSRIGGPGADRRAELGPRHHAGSRPAGRRRRGADPRRRTTGTPAPTSPSCSTGRWTRRPSACRAARSGLRWLAVDQAPRTLGVSLDVPEKVKSGSDADRARQARGPRRRRGGARHGGGRRCRHPQPHALRGAQARGLVLRPAAARHRDPRPLRPPDRRHARRARQAALRRRRRRRHGHAGQPAGGGDAGAVLRHRQGRRRRHGQGRVPAARLQRHGAR